MRGALAVCVLLLCLPPLLAEKASRTVAEVGVPLDGTAVSLPKLGDSGEYRVRVSGVVTCGIDGRQFDARYREDEGKRFTQPHDLVRVEPGGDTLLHEDVASHTYTFGPLNEGVFAGESVTVRLDIDRLVDEFIRTPSEVRESLSGELKARLQYIPPTMAPGMLALAVLVPVLVVALVVALAVQASRAAARRPYEDVNAMRRRIQRKARLALEEMGWSEQLFDHLRRRVAELSETADQLAEHVVTYRSIKLEYSPRGIEEDIARLERQLGRVTAEDVAEELRQEIENKRRTLDYLRANRNREASYLARLSQTETTLDNLRLKLPDLRTSLAQTAERPAVVEIDQELELLKDAIEETRELVLGPA